MLIIRAFILGLALLIPGTKSQAQDETPSQLLERVRSSIVEVRTYDSRIFTESDGHQRVGTYHTQGYGVIIDSYGTIVTNTHIITNAPHIFVGLPDGTILEAKAVYASEADFSFIKIEPPSPLTPITWADPSEAAITTPIIALTNGDDDQQHILGGQITNLIPGVSTETIELLELNLDLTHGDSGGPILDNQGHLLGLIMAKRTDQDNKSYAIASSKIQQEYAQYQQNLPN
jgi:S1-C subfamily serine protease